MYLLLTKSLMGCNDLNQYRVRQLIISFLTIVLNLQAHSL
jgi:hypothetical protein